VNGIRGKQPPPAAAPSDLEFVEVGTPVARRPPHRSRRAVFPHRALRAGTSSSLTGRLARLIRRSHGTGCLCGLRQHVGPFSSFGADALPLDTMSRSDSRSARRRFWSLRRPSCLALAISAAGTLRVSSVPCVCFRARHALRPRQAFHALTVPGVSVLGSGKQTPSPLASCSFEAEWLKQDATPACGSRFSLSTLLDGRSTRRSQSSTGSSSAKQPSVLGSWLDFSIRHFRSELRKLGFRICGAFTLAYARLLRALLLSALRFQVSAFQRFSFLLRGQSSNVRWVCCWRELVLVRHRMKWLQTAGRCFFTCDRVTLWVTRLRKEEKV
jgi:hypothetical protein